MLRMQRGGAHWGGSGAVKRASKGRGNAAGGYKGCVRGMQGGGGALGGDVGLGAVGRGGQRQHAQRRVATCGAGLAYKAVDVTES